MTTTLRASKTVQQTMMMTEITRFIIQRQPSHSSPASSPALILGFMGAIVELLSENLGYAIPLML